MREKKIHPLRELLIGALSLGASKSSDQWECYLTDGFNEALGGEDVFNSDICRCAGGYVLVTLADRNEVSFDIYECGSIELSRIDRSTRQYVITGKGLFIKYSSGDCLLVRPEIERVYHRAEEMLGYTDFQRTYGKQSPYSANDDPWLVDISNGVIDFVGSCGGTICESPVVLNAAIASRFYSKQYQDIRRFADFEVLMEGLFGAWRALVSPEKKDWKLFSDMVRSVFS